MFNKKRRHVDYLRNPMTNDEDKISDTLENIISAIAFNNVDYLNKIILEDAFFVRSVDNKKICKKDFLNWVRSRKHFWLRRLYYSDVLIEFVDKNNANVFFNRSSLLFNFTLTSDKRMYKFVKLNNVWMVAGSFSLTAN